MKLFWAAPARSDLDDLVRYVAQDNLNPAVALWDRIGATATGLVAFPLRGRPGRRDGTRELVVTGTPYVLIYRTGGVVRTVQRIGNRHEGLAQPTLFPD